MLKILMRLVLVPLWINVSLNGAGDNIFIFNFETSLRLRKPSLLRNVETGHAPFRAVFEFG